MQLLDCFDALLAVGHSLIVVEHNLQIMKAADYIIDLGPGAADEGGQVVAKGTPEMVARSGGLGDGEVLGEGAKQHTGGRGDCKLKIEGRESRGRDQGTESARRSSHAKAQAQRHKEEFQISN